MAGIRRINLDVTPSGGELIDAERIRQKYHCRYDSEHDDKHGDGQLARQAAALILSHIPGYAGYSLIDDLDEWGIAAKRKCQVSEVRSLTIAGALIVAELERILRVKK